MDYNFQSLDNFSIDVAKFYFIFKYLKSFIVIRNILNDRSSTFLVNLDQSF